MRINDGYIKKFQGTFSNRFSASMRLGPQSGWFRGEGIGSFAGTTNPDKKIEIEIENIDFTFSNNVPKVSTSKDCLLLRLYKKVRSLFYNRKHLNLKSQDDVGHSTDKDLYQ